MKYFWLILLLLANTASAGNSNFSLDRGTLVCSSLEYLEESVVFKDRVRSLVQFGECISMPKNVESTVIYSNGNRSFVRIEELNLTGWIDTDNLVKR